MIKSALINAREVAEILGTSKSHAYKMVQKLNEELGRLTPTFLRIPHKASRGFIFSSNYVLSIARYGKICYNIAI